MQMMNQMAERTIARTLGIGSAFVAIIVITGTVTDPVNVTLTNNLKNINPTFNTVDVNKNIFDFRITKDAAAPGINKGIATSFAKDLDDKARSVGLPDIGCYEKQ